MSTQTHTTEQPAGFKFNHRAYAECGVASWTGPTASTDDETLNVRFEWDPESGTVATLDGFDGGEYTVDHMRQIHAALGAALDSLEPDREYIATADLGAAVVALQELSKHMQARGYITAAVWDAALTAGQQWKQRAHQ